MALFGEQCERGAHRGSPRRTTGLGVALGLSLWAAAAGCGENLVGAPPAGFQTRRPVAPDAVAGYPAAPPEGYGGNEGEVLPNMGFQGFFSEGPSASTVTDLEFRPFTLQDVRDLEGYTHMLITVAAEWCKPCREEAEVLPLYFERWATRGGYVLGILNQDHQYNAATRATVEGWANRYRTNYTLAEDPDAWVADFLAPTTVPLNVVVDLESMRVLRARAGEDPDTFRFFDDQLAPR